MQENQTIQPENKMGTMPVTRLVLTVSVPMMVSMLVQALYNIVDSIFVAQLSENALTAVSLAFPLQTLLIAVGSGTGVGVNALLSKSLGEKNFHRANDTAANGALLYLLSFLLFFVLGMTVVEPFYAGQIQDADPEIQTLGVQYLSIVMIFSLGVFGQFFFERLLTSTGKTILSMASQLSGAITNLILDPILIFGYLGAPALGVAGAAIATVIGQFVAAGVAAFCHFYFNHEISLRFRGFRPNWAVIGKIYQVGIPSICMQSIGSIMTYCMNLILIGFSSTATAVFGVYYKLQSFFFMPVFGLNNGITPIIAYSYGAGQRKRMVKTIRLSLVVAFCLLAIGFLAFELMPGTLMGLFDASEEMSAIGIPALQIIGIHFLIAWFPIIAGTVFQALGRAVFSLVVSVMRQLVVLIPAAYLLAKSWGLSAVWYAFPIAEIMSAAVSGVFLAYVFRAIIRKIPDGRE